MNRKRKELENIKELRSYQNTGNLKVSEKLDIINCRVILIVSNKILVILILIILIIYKRKDIISDETLLINH